MPFDAKTLLQILILSVGAHIVLSFIRTTRGTGMVRGVLIALFVVFGGLLGLARWLDLAELDFIVDALTGFVVVILAIVFQPELRRGIISLGDNPLLRTVIGRSGTDVTEEVAAACVSMAKRNQGALIAFERKVALDAWTQKAVRLDSRVSRHLLDSLFYPGSALHDGAVIIREGRIAAAQAILPLSEKENLARSIGTRHRAALGLSEETDAIVVAVSEETGLITVCQDGQMERRVLKDELAADLRARLGGEAESRKPAQMRGRVAAALHSVRTTLLSNLGQKLLAVGFGIGLFWVAHRLVRESGTFSMRVLPESGEMARHLPTSQLLRIVLPFDDLHLVEPKEGTSLQVRVTAAQADLATITGGIGGVVSVQGSWIGTARKLSTADVRFGVDGVMDGLDVEWEGDPPTILVERYKEDLVEPSLASFDLDGAGPAGGAQILLPRDLDLDVDSLEFDPPKVRLRGPDDEIQRVLEDPSLLVFREVDVSGEQGSGFVARLRLARGANGSIELEDDLFLRGRLREQETVLAQLELDVALVSFDPRGDGPPPAERFLPPTETVTVRVKANGLIPDNVDEATKTVMRQEILRLVRDHARVYVDVGLYDQTRSRRLPVEVGSLDRLWRELLGPAFALAKTNPSATLSLEIDESDRTVAVEERARDDD